MESGSQSEPVKDAEFAEVPEVEYPQGTPSIGYLDDMIASHFEERILPVPLTERERLELGENITSAYHEREQREAELEVFKERIKAEVKKLDKQIGEAVGALRVGTRDAKVKVQVMKDYRHNIVREMRCDTNTEIGTRPMRTEERQQGLNL